MNQNECKELRNQLKVDSKRMFIPKVATAYIENINGEPTIKSFQLRALDDLSEEDSLLHLKMLKKILSGRIGKNLTEYHFSPSVDAQVKAQKAFYAVNAGRLQDEEQVKNFISNFAKSVPYTMGYYLTLAACEYNIPVIDKNDEEIPEETDGIHRFLLLSINEISPADLGLYYNSDSNVVEYKTDNDLHVLGNSLDGLIFPAFSDRASDVNHILYYTKNAGKPNDYILENVLGFESTLTSAETSSYFKDLLQNVAAEELDLETCKKVFNNVRDIVTDEEEDPMQILGKEALHDLFEASGVSEAKMENFSQAYDQTIGDLALSAINTVDTSKLAIKAADISVTVKPEAAYKVKTKMIDGGLYLCLAIDDGLEINGMPVSK